MSVLRTLASAIVIALLLTPLAGAAEAPSTHIYDARHRSAEELAPLARTLLGEQGVVAVDGGSLILVGPPGLVRRTTEVLEARDVAQRIVTLHLEVRSLASVRSAGYEVDWQGEAGLRSGVLVSRSAHARRLGTGREEHTAFSLRVRDGATGRIDIGRSVTVLSRWLFGSDTTVVAASSELRATPRVLANGERISVELAWSRRDLDDDGRTAGDGGQTTIVVRADEVVVLGALSRRLDQPASRTYGARSQRARSDEQIVLLRIEVD